MNRVWKKSWAFIVALCMVVSMLTPAMAAEDTEDTEVVAVPIMATVTQHWAADELDAWAEKGWLQGDENGDFMPDAGVTRAQFMAFVNRMLGLTEESDSVSGFADVAQDAWYYHDVARALAAGYIQGSGGFMRPNDPISREEAVTILARVAGFADETADETYLAYVPDADKVADWARAALSVAVREGFIAGIDGLFAGSLGITRASTVVMLERVHSDTRVYAFPGTYGGTADAPMMAGAVLISGPGVTFGNAIVKGDVTVGAGAGEGTTAMNNVEIDGALIVDGGNALALNGTFKDIINNVAGLDLAIKGRVDNLKLNASATVTGGAVIEKVDIAESAGEGSSFDSRPSQITGEGAPDATVPPATGSTGGGSYTPPPAATTYGVTVTVIGGGRLETTQNLTGYPAGAEYEIEFDIICDPGYILTGFTVSNDATPDVSTAKYTVKATNANVTIVATFRPLVENLKVAVVSDDAADYAANVPASYVAQYPYDGPGLVHNLPWLVITYDLNVNANVSIAYDLNGADGTFLKWIGTSTSNTAQLNVIENKAAGTGCYAMYELVNDLGLTTGAAQTGLYEVTLTVLGDAFTASATYTAEGETPPVLCTVTFDAQGGSDVAPKTVVQGGTYGALATPTKDNYTFAGWFTAATAGTQVTSADTVGTADITLYARWTATPYTITWNANGGTIGTAGDATYTIETATVTFPASVTKTGYTFGGWFDNAALTGDAVTAIAVGSSGNKTFYAKWTAVEYSITWNLDGGAWGQDTNAKTKFTVADLPYTLPTTITKADKTFAGWYTEAAFTNLVTAIAADTTGNQTFFAKWDELDITLKLGSIELPKQDGYGLETDPTNIGNYEAVAVHGEGTSANPYYIIVHGTDTLANNVPSAGGQPAAAWIGVMIDTGVTLTDVTYNGGGGDYLLQQADIDESATVGASNPASTVTVWVNTNNGAYTDKTFTLKQGGADAVHVHILFVPKANVTAIETAVTTLADKFTAVNGAAAALPNGIVFGAGYPAETSVGDLFLDDPSTYGALATAMTQAENAFAAVGNADPAGSNPHLKSTVETTNAALLDYFDLLDMELTGLNTTAADITGTLTVKYTHWLVPDATATLVLKVTVEKQPTLISALTFKAATLVDEPYQLFQFGYNRQVATPMTILLEVTVPDGGTGNKVIYRYIYDTTTVNENAYVQWGLRDYSSLNFGDGSVTTGPGSVAVDRANDTILDFETVFTATLTATSSSSKHSQTLTYTHAGGVTQSEINQVTYQGIANLAAGLKGYSCRNEAGEIVINISGTVDTGIPAGLETLFDVSQFTGLAKDSGYTAITLEGILSPGTYTIEQTNWALDLYARDKWINITAVIGKAPVKSQEYTIAAADDLSILLTKYEEQESIKLVVDETTYIINYDVNFIVAPPL